ncbi:MAG: pirin family protein [Actinomycetales bacterium]|nr:pirin family protein [Actinomycetales bacterium]
MSNLERDPGEVLLEQRPAGAGPGPAIEILEPRDVPLGGPRAMSVRRTLPQRARSLIGAWCFLDHYGPDDVARTGGMDVPPHPHTGLQTVSWLFRGEIEHRDSVGTVSLVRPGELNLMTAGRGIQHSERSTPGTEVLHGAQLWIALPDGARDVAPAFEAVPAAPLELGDARVQVFLGGLGAARAEARVFSELVAAQIDLPAGGSTELPLDPAFEHGLLVDAGDATVEGYRVAPAHLAYLEPGRASLRVTSGASPTRALLIGGRPLGESIVMWWNFVGRAHDDVAEARARWQAEVIGGGDPAGRFGDIPTDPGPPLPAPELPNLRLKPRG